MFIAQCIDGTWYVREEGAPEGVFVCQVQENKNLTPGFDRALQIVDALNARFQTTDELVQIIRFWFVRVFGRTRELKTPNFNAMVERTEKLLAAYPPRPINPRG